METPSSTRRVTRSQASAMAASNNSNLLNSKPEKSMSKSTQKSAEKPKQDRSVLFDITNDSPIVGLAMGNLETPSSAMSKKRIHRVAKYTRTPGSGEALLRGQVKTLLQKVEEEAEVSKITLENRQPLFDLHGPMNSPAIISLVAPTPANTPQILNFSANGGLPSFTPSPVDEKVYISQKVSGMIQVTEQAGIEESDDLVVTRSLLLDFSDKSQKSDSSVSSVVTYQGVDGESSRDKVSTDDDASIWSIQVNASSARDDEDEEEFEEDYHLEQVCENFDYDCEERGEYGDDNYGLLDDLCEGMSNITVDGIPKFTGKHIRFTYNSDDELQGEEEAISD